MMMERVQTVEVPALSSIKPQSKPILSEKEVLSFENCLIGTKEEQIHNNNNNNNNNNNRLEICSVMKGVFYIDAVLSEEECEALTHAIDESPALTFWCSSEKEEDDENVKSFRNAKTIEIHSDLFCETIWSRIHHLFTTNSVYHVTISEDPEEEAYERDLIGAWLPVGLNPDSLFVKYPSGGSFAPHTDGRAVIDFNTRSHYSVIIFLNSVKKEYGGGTRFYESSAVKELIKVDNRWTSNPSLVLHEVEAVAGRFLFFHQSLVHEGVPPNPDHLKYIIRSDIIYERSPKICNSKKDKEAYQLFRKAEELAENGEVDQSLLYFKKAFKLSPALSQIMGQS